MRIYGVSWLCVVAMTIAGCSGTITPAHAPPAQMMMHPGPGVDGPGPGVLGYPPAEPAPTAASQLLFGHPEGMEVRWDVTAPGRFDSEPLVVPARYSFGQGAIYRLKLSNIAGRPGVELYPTVEVAEARPRTEAFLRTPPCRSQFTEEDFDQVLSGNFVTKVIYLPNPDFQELALAGVDTLVSTRLEPGVDPIIEATRRGSILAVVRLGNKDLQLPSARRGRRAASRRPATRPRCPAVPLADGPLRLHCRRDGAPVRDADVRHADRAARSAPRAVGSPGRIAEAYDCQPYLRVSAGADPRGADRREAEARILLSDAAQPRLHRGDGPLAHARPRAVPGPVPCQKSLAPTRPCPVPACPAAPARCAEPTCPNN